MLSGNWVYNNVRNSGQVGVTAAYPRSGNGSVEMNTLFGPGGASSKADIEFLAQPVNLGGNFVAGGSLGLFSNLNLSGLGYDWYRNSTSSNSAVQHPAYRILLDADGDLTTTGDRGGLVFERAYNGGGPVPTDTWVTETITGSSKVWNFGLGLGFEYVLPFPFGSGSAYEPITAWQAFLPNAVVLGFSVGVGSGWGPFQGAADNIRFGFGTDSTTYNFELLRGPEIPTPAAFMGGSVLMGMLATRRRK
ncbi:MAG: hypothetical protein ACK4PI_01045 [Tepidisphaerales bacterium]